MVIEPNAKDALISLRPEGAFIVQDDGTPEYPLKADGTKHTDNEPTKAEILTELTRIRAVWSTYEYARNRASEYPSQGDQNDTMYKDTKNSTTTHKDAVEAVKTKWPKDNSGPVE